MDRRLSDHWWVPAAVIVAMILLAAARRHGKAAAATESDGGHRRRFPTRVPSLACAGRRVVRGRGIGRTPQPNSKNGQHLRDTHSISKPRRHHVERERGQSDQATPGRGRLHMAYGLYDQAADLVRIALEASRTGAIYASAVGNIFRLGQQGCVPADGEGVGIDARSCPAGDGTRSSS